MTQDPKNSRVWLLGDVWAGQAEDTALPTTLTGDPAGFDNLGCLTTDGLTRSRESSTTELPLWGLGVARVVRSKEKRTFKFAATDDSPALFALVEPNSTVAVALGVATRTVKPSTAVSKVRPWVFETSDGAIKRRICVPRGEVTEVADITAAEEDWEAKEITVTAYPDANGVLFIELTNDPQVTGGDDPEEP